MIQHNQTVAERYAEPAEPTKHANGVTGIHHLALAVHDADASAAIQRWLARRPRYHLHFTPTSSSWLNQVERWFAALTEKQLRRGVFRSTRELEQAIEQYIDQHNAASKPFIWTKTADQLLATIARFCHRIHNSGH